MTSPRRTCHLRGDLLLTYVPHMRLSMDFVDTIVAGQGSIRSPDHDARTIARAADRAEDFGYVRALPSF
ncbi:hypothetical protein Tco_0158177 [Tanacetum coccineum]